MADKVPIRAAYSGASALTGLATFASSETIGVAHGGTGIATVGSNQLLTGNGTSALTSESNLTFDGTILKTTGDLCATVKVVSPALCIGSEYVLPTADGSAGQLMCTNGSGALAFATASAGVTLAGSTNNTIATVTGADALCGEGNLTYDGSTLNVGGAALVDSGATRVISEFTSSNTNGMIVVSADTETLNDTAGIAFNATASSALGSTHSIGNIEGKVVQAGTLKGDLVFHTNSGDSLTEKMRLDNAGRVGIGTTTPANLLEIYGTGNMARLHGSSGTEASMLFTPATNSAWQLGAGVLDTCTFQIYANSPNKSRLTLMEIGGSMGVGDNSAYSGGTALPNGAPPVDSTNVTTLKVDGGINVDAALQVSGYNDSHGLDIWTDVSIGDVYFDQRGDHDNYDFRFRTRTTGTPINAFTITGAGAISKSSGSFKIDHPLPEKTDTHHLVHSFVEGPQADLLYRGTATLSNGTATVNIDTAARMTDGTFVALNGNVQAFTTNESGFDAVRGSVSGNVLTITSIDDTSTATINWLVVGERHDPHMVSAGTTWTDNDGRVITEPIKEEDPNRMTPARQEAESA